MPHLHLALRYACMMVSVGASDDSFAADAAVDPCDGCGYLEHSIIFGGGAQTTGGASKGLGLQPMRLLGHGFDGLHVAEVPAGSARELVLGHDFGVDRDLNE